MNATIVAGAIDANPTGLYNALYIFSPERRLAGLS